MFLIRNVRNYRRRRNVDVNVHYINIFDEINNIIVDTNSSFYIRIVRGEYNLNTQHINYLPWYCENVSAEQFANEKCVICFEAECTVKCQQCVYYFHKQCVESHKSSRVRCPTCRHEIVEEL